jgi:hypothetical protein
MRLDTDSEFYRVRDLGIRTSRRQQPGRMPKQS